MTSCPKQGSSQRNIALISIVKEKTLQENKLDIIQPYAINENIEHKKDK